MKKTTNAKTTHPNTKLGAITGAVIIALVAIALIVLNFAKITFGILAIDVFIAYGPIVALFLLFAAGALVCD